MKSLKFVKNPYTSLAFNAIYALGNCIIGFLTHSWWFITVGAYYTVLATTRFSVLWPCPFPDWNRAVSWAWIFSREQQFSKANKKIAETVTGGYKKIEKGVVDGYKKNEMGVVHGYSKIEDKFVDAYLTKDGETVEEAKARLKSRNWFSAIRFASFTVERYCDTP